MPEMSGAREDMVVERQAVVWFSGALLLLLKGGGGKGPTNTRSKVIALFPCLAGLHPWPGKLERN